MTTETLDRSYRPYWIAWGILLALTLVMIGVANPPVLIAGMALKASIIALWFMHLRHEKPLLVAVVALALLGTTLILFGLTAVDGLAAAP